MKRNIFIAMALLLVVPLLSGCGGVPQEDLDTALAEAQAAKSQLASAQSDLTKAKSDLSAAKSDLSAAESEAEALQSDLSKAKSDLSAAKSAKAAAESDLTAAQEQIAALEAAAEEAVVEEEVVEEEVVEEEVAEEEAVEEEVVEEVAGGYGYDHSAELSFAGAATEVTIEEYGFSFQHTNAWFATGGEGTISYEFGDAAGMNGAWTAAVPVADAATFEDALVVQMPDVDIFNVWDTTLADGTPAFVSDSNGTAGGYLLSVFAIGVQSGDNWIMILIWHWPPAAEWDQAPDAELVHTLTLQ